MLGFVGLGELLESVVKGETFSVEPGAVMIGVFGLVVAALGVYLRSEGER